MRDKEGNQYFCKQFDIRNENSDWQFLRELETHITLKHQTVLPLAGHFFLPNKNTHCILTKQCEMGTLADKLSDDPSFMTCTKRIICIIDIILAMIHISQNKIIHRDIKPSNIFVSNDYFMVGDFGISKFAFDIRDEITGVVGTFGFHAPEVLVSGEYNEKSDVFSSGLVFYELLTEKSIFIDGVTPQVFNQRIIDGTHPIIPYELSKNARLFLKMCLETHADERK